MIEYIKIFRKRKINSEIYYLIKLGNETIGFVNLHYKNKLNNKKLSEQVELLNKETGGLGVLIDLKYSNSIIPQFMKLFNSFSFISEKNKVILYSLLKKRYSGNKYITIDGLENISVEGLKRILGINKSSNYDSVTYVKIHKELFSDIVVDTLTNKLDDFATARIGVTNEENYPIVEIDINIELNYPLGDIIQKARLYLEAFDLLPHIINEEIPLSFIQHLLPFKCYFNLTAAKIIPKAIDDRTLNLRVLVPKKR